MYLCAIDNSCRVRVRITKPHILYIWRMYPVLTFFLFIISLLLITCIYIRIFYSKLSSIRRTLERRWKKKEIERKFYMNSFNKEINALIIRCYKINEEEKNFTEKDFYITTSVCARRGLNTRRSIWQLNCDQMMTICTADPWYK